MGSYQLLRKFLNVCTWYIHSYPHVAESSPWSHTAARKAESHTLYSGGLVPVMLSQLLWQGKGQWMLVAN